MVKHIKKIFANKQGVKILEKIMDKQNLLKELGLQIKFERLKRNLTQEEMAERIKISRNAISLIENGKINPTFLVLYAISKEFGVDILKFIEK